MRSLQPLSASKVDHAKGNSASGVTVLALVTDAYGGYGGIAQYNRDLIRALAAQPGVMRVEVLPRVGNGPMEPVQDKVHQYAAIQVRSAYAVRALGLAMKLKPDIIFNGHIYHSTLSHLAARLAGARLVSQVHGTEVWGDVAPWLRRSLKVSDLVLAVSRDTRARFLSKVDIAPERVAVLNNTVGPEFTPGDRKAARARFGLGEEFAVLTVARLDGRDGYKGHDRVICLMPSIRAKGVEAVYLIAGVGEDRARLEQLADGCGVRGSVRFLGKVPQSDLPDLYRAADLFALPSTGEGFGITFLEAMACGTPCIGLALGGAPDALGDGELGACVDEEDFAKTFLATVGASRTGSRAPAESIQNRFGWPVFRDRVGQMLTLL